MVGTGGILGHLLWSLWLPFWHLKTSYSANRQAGPDFSCGLVHRPCGWWLRATQQALEDAGQLCRVCVRAAGAAGLFPARTRGDGLEKASLPLPCLLLPCSSQDPGPTVLAGCQGSLTYRMYSVCSLPLSTQKLPVGLSAPQAPRLRFDLGWLMVWHDSLHHTSRSPERQTQATPEVLHAKRAVKSTGSGVTMPGLKAQFSSLSAGPVTLPG